MDNVSRGVLPNRRRNASIVTMRKPTSRKVPAALLVASAFTLVLAVPTSAADPATAPAADPSAASCAALSKVQPEIDDLRAKAGSYIANPGQLGGGQPKSPSSTTTTAQPEASNLQNITDSLRHLGDELKSAAPTVKDTSLRGSTDKLATTVTEAASDMATMQTGSPNLFKLGSLGFNITSAIVFYEINHNRVCGQIPADQQAPPTTAPAPTKPATPTTAPAKPATPQPQKKPA